MKVLLQLFVLLMRQLVSLIADFHSQMEIVATTSGVGTDSNLVNVKMKALPQITEFNILKCPRNPDNVFNQMGPLLLFAPMMVIFFSTANTIASEKERYLKDSMEMIGLKPSIYWLSHYISASVLVLINSIITVFIGYGFGFSLLTKTDLGVSYSCIVKDPKQIRSRSFCSSCLECHLFQWHCLFRVSVKK